MTFKELGDIHPQIVEKCRERAIEQGSQFNLNSTIIAGKSSGGFSWSETLEYKKDSGFWSNVLDNKHFDIFYEKYPKIENKIELISEEPIIYKGIVNNRKVKITIEYEDTIKQS